jgi:hypothetical protein
VPELTTADVEQYTSGRLPASDAETTRLLDAALKTLRRYCGWRVTPAASETLTLDGPGRHRLSLPTLHLVELESITEDGVVIDLTTLYVSPLGVVRKKSGACWSRNYGAIEVTMTHGYDDATDWQSAVLELIDRMASQVGLVAGNSGPPVEKQVDDVSYRWILTVGNTPSLFDMINHTLVDPYRIEPST